MRSLKNRESELESNTKVNHTNSVVVGSYVTTEFDNSIYLGNQSKAASTAHSKRMEEYSKEIINGREHSFAGGKASGIVTVGQEGREKKNSKCSGRMD